MPFIPHTEDDIKSMLASIGVDSIDDLFDEIPEDLRSGKLEKVPPGMSEMEVSRLMEDRAEQDGRYLNFIGAGAYEHHIPAAVWQIATRGEFYSSYTPYQAEASQGTLQLLYEFQTMMASLTGMDVSNTSMYDGASALAEAVLMAVRSHKTSRRILMPRTVNPIYRRVVTSIVSAQGIELVEVDYDSKQGITDMAKLPAGEFAALVIPQPNFFGCLEEVDALTDWTHQHGGVAIGLVNPTSLALLTPPGQWGTKGADIAVGEGQPLGSPLSSGGPYFGFMCCKQNLVRQMPGRIVGRTVDLEGKEGFTLTLQAREQHIRRAKATSNICTNQGLLVAAATIHMALLGPEGLRRVAVHCMRNARALRTKLIAVPGVRALFARPGFHEFALALPQPAAAVIENLAGDERILAGVALGDDFPELGDALLVCATETKAGADLDRFASALARVVR